MHGGSKGGKVQIFSKNLLERVVIWNTYSKEEKIMLNGSERNRVWMHELD
jgi:hypothetical protein